MSKNVLALLGSARQNNTYTLLQNFISGAEIAGNDVTMIPIGSKEIHGCYGCGACRKQNSRCVQSDDMELVYNAIEKADVVVLASPIYYANITAQTKAVIDRLYCFSPPLQKESYLLLTAGGGSGKNVDSAFSTYEMAAQYLSWVDKGTLLADYVETKKDVLSHPAYAAAYEMGLKV